MEFGVLYSYWGNEWKCNYIETAEKIQKAGFDKKRLFYTQGDYGLLQCNMFR